MKLYAIEITACRDCGHVQEFLAAWGRHYDDKWRCGRLTSNDIGKLVKPDEIDPDCPLEDAGEARAEWEVWEAARTERRKANYRIKGSQ